MGIFVKSPAVRNYCGQCIWGCYVSEGGTGTGNRLIGSTARHYVRNNFFWKKPVDSKFNIMFLRVTSPEPTENNASAVVFEDIASWETSRLILLD